MDLMAEKVDRKQLVDLLKHMLMLDQERRIKPDEALNHPFQTTTHLLDYVHCTTYVTPEVYDDMLVFRPSVRWTVGLCVRKGQKDVAFWSGLPHQP